MRVKFEKQLTDLNDELIHMGSMIEQAIEMSISALVRQDEDKARKTIMFSDEIEHMEKEIENRCFRILLSQQPVAGDLRRVSSALKMVTDMKRIGDFAGDISEISLNLLGQEYIKKLDHLTKMAKETTVMVINSIEAFVQEDVVLAGEVIKSDDIVDELFLTVKDELIDLILKNPENGSQATDMLMIAKYFERIGDHAENIAKWVIFSVTGKKE
ncbi:MAG: phosphate signaling complex protein PhoU [Lachnospiraceae bacterium]|nr:phosphate signaling complex protein PhoU [Lachnospiraceae bacterium]